MKSGDYHLKYCVVKRVCYTECIYNAVLVNIKAFNDKW